MAMAQVHYQVGKFPPQDLNWRRLAPLLGDARADVAAFDSMLVNVPNASVLLSPLLKQEAVSSTRIEGTQVTLAEVLAFEAEGDLTDESTPERADRREAFNYIVALRNAITSMEEKNLPLCQRVLRAAHFDLMQGVRGQFKSPGEYRRIQNFIGQTTKIEDAEFVPCPTEEVESAMERWESFIHEDTLDPLIQVALLHAEFEAIHPFLDGNGRIGRLLIPLSMVEKKLIFRPYFYISECLEAYREAYIEHLRAVSRDNDWDGWCAFFLDMVRLQASHNQNKALRILKLYGDVKERVSKQTRSGFRDRAVDWILNRPVFRAIDFAKNAGIPEDTARNFLRLLKDIGVLKEMVPSSGRTSAVLAFPDLIAIVEEGISH